MRADTEPWWRQSEADLRAAELLLQGGEYHAASWYSQPAAEKALKAVLIERSTGIPPRTHDLRFLGQHLGVPASVRAGLALLYPVFRIARYPDDQTAAAPVDVIGQTDANAHLDAARRVCAWSLAEINP